MRTRRAISLVFGTFVVAALFGAGAPTKMGASPVGQSATIEVKMVEFGLQPQTVTIQVGQAVSWINNGSVTHTTTSDQQSGDTTCCWDVTVPTGFTFERVFPTAGTFTYHCKFHRDQGMTGQVVVQQGSSPTPTGTATSGPSATPTRTNTPGGPTPTGTPPTPTQSAGTPTNQPQFFINSPTEGQVILSADVPVRLEVTNLTLRAPGSGPNRQGEGYFALFLDNLPEVKVGDKSYNFPNVAPGNHTLRVELRQNDGTPLTPPLQANVNFRSSGGISLTVTPQLPGQPTIPPIAPTAIATIIGPTATVGLPKTGDGTYRRDEGSPVAGWLTIAAPALVFAAALVVRARRSKS